MFCIESAEELSINESRGAVSERADVIALVRVGGKACNSTFCCKESPSSL